MSNGLWTQEEVRAYRQIESPVLDRLYAEAKLSANQPEERARYFSEILNLTMTDHDLIMRIAAKNGRPAALNLLEEMAIKDSQSTK